MNFYLIRLMTSQGFLREKYFFIFIDRAIRETRTYTRRNKNEWFRHSKTYYA